MGNSIIKVTIENPEGLSSLVDIERKSVNSCRDICLHICQELLINFNDVQFEWFHPEQEKYIPFPGHLKLDDIVNELNLRYREKKNKLYTLGDSSDDLSSLSPYEKIEVPVELVQGIRNLSNKKFYPFSYSRKICLVGGKGCGKSSLLNYLMSGNSEYVCPVRPDHETKSISFHQYYSPFESSEINVNELKEMMIQRNECEVDQFTVNSFSRHELEPLTFIDTPGLDETTLFPSQGVSVKKEEEKKKKKKKQNENEESEGEEEEEGDNMKTFVENKISSHLQNKRRILVEKVIEESNVVLFLIEPDELVKDGTVVINNDDDDKEEESSVSLFRYIARISELNRNVIIVITKFDIIVDSIVAEKMEQKRTNNEGNETSNGHKDQQQQQTEHSLDPDELSKIIMDRMKKIHRSFKFGAPVVCVQVKKKASVDGPNFFTTENLIDLLLKYQSLNHKGSFLYLRNLIYEKLNVEKRIPMGVLSGRMKKKKKQVRKWARAGATGAGLGAIGTVGTGVVAGGLGILGIAAGGLAMAGGAALLVTGVGEILMLMGGGMIAAGAAVTAGSVAVGTTAMVVGTGATMALGSTASILLSKDLADYSLQVPAYARLSMSAFHTRVESIIGTIRLKKSMWKQLMAYEKKSRIPLSEVTSSAKDRKRKKSWKKRNWGKTYFRMERMDELYKDTVVVKLIQQQQEEEEEERYFLAEVIMRGDKLISIVDVFRVIQEEEEKKKKKEKVMTTQNSLLSEEIKDQREEEKEEEEEEFGDVSRLIFDDSDDTTTTDDDEKQQQQQQQQQQQYNIPENQKNDDDEDEGQHIYDDDDVVLNMVEKSLDDDLVPQKMNIEENKNTSGSKVKKKNTSFDDLDYVHSPGEISIDSSDSKTFSLKGFGFGEQDQHSGLMTEFDIIKIGEQGEKQEDDGDEGLYCCPLCKVSEEESIIVMKLQQLVHHTEEKHMDDTSPAECPKCKIVVRNLYFHLVEHVIKSCGKK